ncbi:hypothetical protein R3W88_021652 [Solanum pinnatisectum]|uniref:Cytochrome P450 n=1 Tax=Solanum pinnatisectum TaxID=50273 RepID=A0AAV9LSE2_9SOLN|nr:hypothetical protein R3W88_021652 [Solanum pinnatisectum]
MAQQFEILFLLPLFLLPLIFFIFKIFKSSKITQLPPGPTPWPVIGNIFQIGNMPHITLTNFARTYGPLISLRLGTQCLVVGSSPSVAIEIFKTHDRILSGRYVPNAVRSNGTNLEKTSLGWKSECDSGWRYLRTLCRTELFAGKVLESQACLREKKVMELVEFLRSKEGEVVNIGELVFATVLNMLSNVLISKDMINLEEETEDGEIKSLVRGIVEVGSAPNISDFYPILGKLDLQGLRKKIYRFSDKELLSAGSDTSTTAIEWAMAELIKNVVTMKKVQEELEIELSESDYLKESQVLQMSYVQACVKEAFRLHPPAPLLLPHRLYRNTPDPFIWEERTCLDARFTSSDMDFKGNDFEFLPFSAGRRMCPGMPMAAIQVPLVLASLVHFFDWELPHGKCPVELDMTEKFGITLQKKEPLLLIPKARK